MPAGKSFSARGIEICVEYFKNLGHEEIVVWLPRFRQGNRDFSDNQTIIRKLERNIKWTTSRTLTSGQKISSYDDRAIVQDAAFCGGVILSNDNYRDIVNESREMKTAIEERLLNFNFRKDTLHVAQDPLGRIGPRLDKFLAFNNSDINFNYECREEVKVKAESFEKMANAAQPLSVNNQIPWKSSRELKKERKENKKIQRLERLKLASEMKRKSMTEPQNYIQADLIIKKEFQNPLQLQLNSSKFSPLANMVYKPVNDTNASKSDAESEQLEKAANKFLKAALNSTNKGFGSFGQNGL